MSLKSILPVCVYFFKVATRKCEITYAASHLWLTYLWLLKDTIRDLRPPNFSCYKGPYGTYLSLWTTQCPSKLLSLAVV